MSDLPERDWKLLRELTPVLLERSCGQFLQRATGIAATSSTTNHERYLKLYDLIKKQDREIALAFDDHRRSTAFMKILQIRKLGLFTADEFARFSEGTRKCVLDIESM